MPPLQDLLTPAATTAWVVGALFVWLLYSYNVMGSFQPYCYDKRQVGMRQKVEELPCTYPHPPTYPHTTRTPNPIHHPHRGKRLPGPRNEWPFGFVWTIRAWRNQHIWWIKSREIFAEYGPLIGFRVFSRYSVLSTDPEVVRAIVTGSADDFPKGHLYKQLGLLPGGIFTTNGPRWRRDRRLLNHKFHYDAVGSYVRSFNAHVSEFVGGLRRCLPGHEGLVLDMVHGFNRLTLDIICDAGFGYDLHSVRQIRARASQRMDGDGNSHPRSIPTEGMEPLVKGGMDEEGDAMCEALRITFQEVAQRMTDPLPVFKYLPHRHHRTMQAKRVLRKVIEQAVAARKHPSGVAEGGEALGGSSGTLMDLMVAVHEEGTWSTDDLLAQSMTFLIAGHETTSAMLTWTLLELGENPDILGKLRAEIDGVVGQSPTVEAAHVENMPYLRCILKESLRMHPPVTMFSRQTLKDLEVGGYLIPAGWHVGVSVDRLHRSPDLWDRPDDFWPERWAEGGGGGLDTMTTKKSSTGGGGAGISPPRTPSPQPAAVGGGAPAAPFFPPASAAHARRSSISASSTPSLEGGHSTYKSPLKTPFQYVPFSLGPRNCIGQRFGMMEASVILARLLREWDITLLDRAHTIAPVELLTVRPDRLLCKFTPRVVPPPAPVVVGTGPSRSGSVAGSP